MHVHATPTRSASSSTARGLDHDDERDAVVADREPRVPRRRHGRGRRDRGRAIFAADFANTSLTRAARSSSRRSTRAAKLVALIETATKTIDIEAEELTRPQISPPSPRRPRRECTWPCCGTSPTRRAHRGAPLKAAGVQLVTFGKYYVHAKSIVVDGTLRLRRLGELLDGLAPIQPRALQCSPTTRREVDVEPVGRRAVGDTRWPRRASPRGSRTADRARARRGRNRPRAPSRSSRPHAHPRPARARATSIRTPRHRASSPRADRALRRRSPRCTSTSSG